MDFEYVKTKFKEKGYEMDVQFLDLKQDEDFHVFEFDSSKNKIRINSYDWELENNCYLLKQKIVKGLIYYVGLFEFERFDLDVEKVLADGQEKLDKILDEFAPLHRRFNLIDKRKKRLDRIKNYFVPSVQENIENYFGEKFVENHVEEYKIRNLLFYHAILAKSDSGEKFDVVFDDVSEESFLGNDLSGRGIFTLLHELSHVYQFHKLGIDLPKLNHSFQEAHAELSSYEIVKSNLDNPILNDSLNYANGNHKEFLFNSPVERYTSEYKILMKEKDLEKRIKMIPLKNL